MSSTKNHNTLNKQLMGTTFLDLAAINSSVAMKMTTVTLNLSINLLCGCRKDLYTLIKQSQPHTCFIHKLTLLRVSIIRNRF